VVEEDVMRLRRFGPQLLAAAVASSLTSFVVTALSANTRSVPNRNATNVTASPALLVQYLVRFEEPALAAYADPQTATAAGVAPIPLARSVGGRLRPDVGSAEARSQLARLQTRQDQHFADITRDLGRIPEKVYSMRHALNAQVLRLSADEALRVARMAGVAAVEPDRMLAPTTDIGPGFIGAASVWWGTRAAEDSIFAAGFTSASGYRGDGVVIGMIDGGYNSLSPSFQAVDSLGRALVNPLGHGHFLGQCSVPGISIGGCNDKVIGVWDEFGLTGGGVDPVYSVEDVAGHGSHIASTAAGNVRAATLAGFSASLSGVAPHANLVIFRACSPEPNVGCPVTAIVASIDQSVADGVVDALNYSITGGETPWSESISLAFLAAANAGIFVAAAAGNSPVPDAGSVLNRAPWVATAGAGTDIGGALEAGPPVVRAAEQPDMLAAFSELGPVSFNVIKPDMQSPGVNIIAAVENDGTAGGAQLVGMKNGTSMAAAHTTGSGALLLGLHPSWTPLEVKSALMMTAQETGLTKADGVTPSDWFDRGAGRLRDDVAGNAGLVLHETMANFTAANPQTGGNPATLNLASMQNAACVQTCTFTRTFRSTQNHTVTWTSHVQAGPNPGFAAVTVSPSTFPVKALALNGPVTFTVNASQLAADGTFHFAEVVLTPSDNQLPPLHLPLAVAVPAN
jgi:hypothetical protein